MSDRFEITRPCCHGRPREMAPSSVALALCMDSGTVFVDYECEPIILAEEANMISISKLYVCSLPSKLDIPDFIEFIESHTINCYM